MPSVMPDSPEDLACALVDAASARRSITLIGRNSKRGMAGPMQTADVCISTAALHRVLQYEPNDLTISVEAGHPFADLQNLLGKHGQMIALDPPFSRDATIGGTVAANQSGPLSRGFGTARDLIIGMRLATVDGKLIQSGGMVVKNVAGLDMAKIAIGSFGTLAAITSLNFRVHSLPEGTRSFLFSFSDPDTLFAKRDAVLAGALQPMALDLLSPAASARLGRRGYILVVRGGGSRAVLDRYERELSGSEPLSGKGEGDLWTLIREFTADFLRRQPSGIVLRVSTTLGEMLPVLRSVTGPAIARAGSGVSYIYASSWQGAQQLWKLAAERRWSAVIEFAPDDIRASKELWSIPPSSGAQNAFVMMKEIKRMFDPQNLLNSLRLYGRI